jgi:two-component system, NtrC family, C4-dicarboxylate transport sensor histidine kinase DctB
VPAPGRRDDGFSQRPAREEPSAQRPPGSVGWLRSRKRWLAPLLLAFATCAALAWLLHTTASVRSEARQRFYEQYNQQQLLIATQAARTLEELFETFRRDLSLIAALFENRAVTRERAAEVKESLARVFGSLAGAPILDVAVFDRGGTIVASYPPSPHTAGVNLAWRDYFAWARDQGGPGQMYLTAFRVQAAGLVKGTKAFNAVQGIYAKDGSFQGIALLTVDFDELARRHVSSARIGENGYAWLADSDSRTVLVDPRGRVNGLGFEEAFLPRWPGLYSLLLTMGEGRPGTGAYEFEDPVDPSKAVRKLVAYAPVRFGDRLWVLGVATPEREVEALLSSFLQRQEIFSTTMGITILATGLLVFGFLVGWNRVLTRQVAVRTEDLARVRSELLSAEKLAATGHLALGMIHEIRNPLSAIRMNVQMIREESPLRGELSENFEIVEQEILRLNRLLSDVMGFARPRPLRLAQADLGEEVRQVARLLAGVLAEERVAVELQFNGELGIVCDPEQIQQVLLNLFLNAMEAMKESPRAKQLFVSVGRSGGFAFVRVADTGVGVRSEDRGRIFDPFFTTKARGGGLGLSTLQSIVLRHGGRVDVESDGRSGAAFTVRFPVGGPTNADESGSREQAS